MTATELKTKYNLRYTPAVTTSYELAVGMVNNIYTTRGKSGAVLEFSKDIFVVAVCLSDAHKLHRAGLIYVK